MGLYQPAGTREVFLNYLRQQGIPEHALTAIDWNAADESSWDPGAIGDNENSIGVLQWNGPRAAALRAAAEREGLDWRDPIVQAKHFLSEVSGPEKAAWDTVLAAPDERHAAAAFVERFERPAKSHLDRRKGNYMGGNVGKSGGVGVFPEEAITGLDATMSSRGGGGNGQATGGRIPPATRGDKWRIVLQAFSEGMGALGSGHAADFEATDAFVNRLAQERYLNAQAPGQLDPTVNQTIAQLEQMGRPDLAESVRNSGLKPDDALKEAFKTATLPGRELSESELVLANQLRDEMNVKAAPLAQIELAAGNVLASAADPSGVNDAVLVQQFAKLLDPISVVREGEVAMVSSAAGGAQGWLQSWQNFLNQEGSLTPQARADLIAKTTAILEASRRQTRGYYDSYGQLLQAQGIDPKWLGSLPEQGAPTNAGPSAEPEVTIDDVVGH